MDKFCFASKLIPAASTAQTASSKINSWRRKNASAPGPSGLVDIIFAPRHDDSLSCTFPFGNVAALGRSPIRDRLYRYYLGHFNTAEHSTEMADKRDAPAEKIISCCRRSWI